MAEKNISLTDLAEFAVYLQDEERSEGTVEKYLRDVRHFIEWAGGRQINKQAVGEWKEHLIAMGYQPVTVNSMLAAINTLCNFMGWDDCRVKYLKIQRKVFRDKSRELTRNDYTQLLAAAEKNGQNRLHLLLETICATGIRVSEVRYITVEALRQGKAEVSLKGKTRTILLPGKLCKKLLQYAQKQKIASGEIFLTKSGKSLNRKQIWAEMKRLCKSCGVEAGKVFPHNLRHLFARTFYQVCKDVVRLADVLGHSSIDTTRIYLISTGAEHAKVMARLGLIS
ncbi:MAG: tyrosine-type recombinase/integrase [Firmicutes bacterium]|nr:tyrosine-type recombinase/integrase [Bacillota bacterium]